MNYCSKCGHKLGDQDKFCPKCGQKASTSLEPHYQPIETTSIQTSRPSGETYDDFLMFPEYYQEEFRKIAESNGAYTGKFNWPAFLFGPLWAISKGLWLVALVAFFASLLTGGLAAVIYWFIFGFRGNYMYYRKVVNKEQTIF